MFVKGITGPEEQGMEELAYANGPRWYARVVYDLSFFVIVGVLLFNLVTGLIIDTFSELRAESDGRETQLSTVCFICGITRERLEDMPMGPSGERHDFDEHCEEDHRWEEYVYFHCYLVRKDPTEYNGAESDVVRRMEERDTSWLPSRNSWRLQEAARRSSSGAGADGDGAGADGAEDGAEGAAAGVVGPQMQAQIQTELRKMLKELLEKQQD
jgi:hypothetical protein